MSVDRRAFIQTTSAGGLALAAETSLEHNGTLTDVPGVRVGHFTSERRPTGCTVMLFDNGAVGGVDVRGSAPGTRETDLLHPLNTVQTVNAFVLSGGSAFGLDAASGVMRFLDERQIGYRVGPLVVPIVPAAIIFDLNVGDGKIRPDAEAGYEACKAASAKPVTQGNVGAGAGATVGKFFGFQSAMKGGLGSASMRVPGTDLVVGAIAAVNAAGDVIEHHTGTILAGSRSDDGKSFRNTMTSMSHGQLVKAQRGANSTVAVVATNARLTKVEANKMAQMAHDGFARAINPVHTAVDGDTIFAAATGRSKTEVNLIALGSIGAECMALAIQNAVKFAASIPGYPAHRDFVKAVTLPAKAAHFDFVVLYDHALFLMTFTAGEHQLMCARR